MGSFFQPGADTQTPQSSTVTTRENSANPTGASTGPGTATPANTGSAIQGSGQAPAWTNLKDFLGAQSDSQVQAGVNKVTGEADKNADQATSTGNSAAAAQKAAITSGTSTGGGVFGTNPPATPSVPSAPAGLTGLTASLKPTTAQSIGTGGVDTTLTNASYTPPPVDPASGIDLSKVNLAGYQGPSAGQVTQGFQNALGAANMAGQNAAAGRTGKVTANVFDNALMTQTPAWQKIQQALTGEQHAADATNAQAKGALEAQNQAAIASGANVNRQKGELTDTATGLAKTATANASALKTVATALSSKDPKAIASALDSSTAQLQSAGLSPQEAATISAGLKNGSVLPDQAQAQLQPYIDALNSSSGYTGAGADKTNQINGLLKNGATATGPAQGVQTDTSTAAAKQALQNSHDINIISQSAEANNPATVAAVKDLKAQGYTTEQIMQLMGGGSKNSPTIGNNGVPVSPGPTGFGSF